jgi:hypothetical protein
VFEVIPADLRIFAERLDAARTDEEARAAMDARRSEALPTGPRFT